MKSRFELIRHTIQATIFYLAPRLSNVILFILISWSFGPTDAGIYTLGVTFLLILNVITRGIDDLIIRECAQLNQDAEQLMARFGLLRLLLVLFFYCLLWLSLTVGFQYETDATNFILIMALVAFPDALIATGQSIFVGLRNFKKPSWVIGSTNLLKLTLGALITLQVGSLTLLAWSAVASYVVGAILMLFALIAHLENERQKIATPSESATTSYSRLFGRQMKIRLQLPSASVLRRDLRQSLPFMGITGLVGAEGQVDIILLSMLQSKQAVGWYGAATTVTSSFAILSQAYRQSLYPLMASHVADIQRHDNQKDEPLLADNVLSDGAANLNDSSIAYLYKQSIRYLGLLSFPIAAGTILIAPRLTALLFSSAFEPTTTIIQILAINIPFGFLSVPNSRLMFAYRAQKYLLVFVAMAFMLNIGLNFLLTPTFSSNGAAFSRTAAVVLIFSCSHLYVYSMILRQSVWSEIARPLLATGIMVVALWSLRNANLLLIIGVGIVAYALAVWLTRAIPKEDFELIRSAFVTRFNQPKAKPSS